MYSMLQEWNILDNGFKIDFYQENGHILMEHISKEISRIINLKDEEDGYWLMETMYKDNMIK